MDQIAQAWLAHPGTARLRASFHARLAALEDQIVVLAGPHQDQEARLALSGARDHLREVYEELFGEEMTRERRQG